MASSIAKGPQSFCNSAATDTGATDTRPLEDAAAGLFNTGAPEGAAAAGRFIPMALSEKGIAV